MTSCYKFKQNDYQKQLKKLDDNMDDARILIEEGIADSIWISICDKGYKRQMATPAEMIKTTRQTVFYLGAEVNMRIAEEWQTLNHLKFMS
jgi:hypothetical protein